MGIPEVRITFSDLLYYGESKALYEHWTKPADRKKYPLISYDECKKLEKQYRVAWAKHDKKVLRAMQQVLGLEFYSPVIDLALAPMFIPMSQPLIMSFHQSPKRFVDTLIHELFHVLLTDNKTVSNRKQETDLVQRWQKLYGKDHSWLTLVHIPVHAGCKYIYSDILNNPKSVDEDIEDIKKWGNEASLSYLASWEYVNKHDYKKILADLKQMYSESKQA